ncbi:MAG: beta-glucosidase BglX, partial [Saprospiraceae bacterium]|nr:beta-glucosidase BglX [Saprospiraceae bacterium]
IHGYQTLTPLPLAEAASWDLTAIEKSARNAATEAAAAGLNWTFAPMVDVSRDARWGRVMEGAGEDTYLGSAIAAARVKGFQGDDLSATNTVAACAKHFAAYGFVEAGKEYNTVDIGTSTLFNVVFPPFKACLDAGVRTFMNSFNELNGVAATGDKYLQRDILKGEWGFDGFVVSDWGSIGEMMEHGHAKDLKSAAQIAANAGSDMDMESHAYLKHLVTLVEEGKVEEKVVDDAVGRILKVKFELGLFEDPFKYCDPEREKTVIGSPQMLQDAEDMAKRSIVLLKNEGDLLPLAKSGLKIAVLGALANDKDSPLGSWRLAGIPNSATTVFQAMENACDNFLMHARGPEVVVGETHFVYETEVNDSDRSGWEEAIEEASKADVVVMALGEHGFLSGEGRSRAAIGLPGVQQEFLEAIHAVNKNIVLLLMNGRPLTIPWAAENIPAILEVWQLGTRSGEAISSVVFGDYNPSGKLPMSFPRSVGQVPIYYNYKNTGRPQKKNPNEVFWAHYIDEVNSPLFSFGHGLSYTNFEYNNLTATQSGKGVEVSLELKNTGELEGEEVVQLYIRDRVASVTRPVKELKGFEKVSLQPGENKTIRFSLSHAELGFYNNQGKFIFEPGEFDIMVGGSSETQLASEVEIAELRP